MSGCHNSEKCECFGCLRAQLCALEQALNILANSHTSQDVRIYNVEKQRFLESEDHLINHAYDGIDKCFERIEKLEERFENLYIRVHLLTTPIDKKPYKCPVCDGQGGTKISGTIDEECHSCEGKGIIWG